MNKFRTVVSILCGVAGLFLGASLNNAIGGCILGVLISALPQDQKKEIAEYLRMASVSYCIKRYVDPLVDDGILALAEPKSKRSHTQKYFTVK